MRRIKLLRAALVVIMICGLAGLMACDSPTPPPKPPPDGSANKTPDAVEPVKAPPVKTPEPGKTLRFAFIPKALHIPVFSYAKTGAERQAKEYGNVKILWNAPSTNDQVRQKEILETYIAMGVDGIAISCLNGDYLTPAIDEAVAAGIPVITWDSDAPKSKRTAFYGVNDFESGVIMGKEVARLLGEEGGEIAVITTLGADNLAQRLEGAMSVIRQHPQIKIVETFDVEDQAIKTKNVIEITTASNPGLRAWLSVGGWPGFSRNILDPVDPAKTFVVSFDTIPPAPDIIKEGKIQLALGQKYFGWGSETTKILYDVVVNGKKPKGDMIDSGVDIVTPDNVDQYMEKWKKMEAGEIAE